MQRISRFVLLAAAILLPGCAREKPAPRPPEPERFEVALLTSGSIADEGWNAAAYQGIKRIQNELGAAALQQEVRIPADRHARMRALGESRFEVVFGHGPEFGDAARASAPSYPRTVFIVTGGDGIGPNLAPLHFRIEEATWLLGMAAASQSAGARAGAVGTSRSPATLAAFDAFRRGAQSVRGDFQVEEVFTDDPRDETAARAAAIRLIDGGAGALLHSAGEAGAGVLAACTERRIVCFAIPANQNDRAPDALLASAVADVPTAMAEIASLVRHGRFQPRLFSYGMKEGMVTVAWNEELRRRIPPDAMKRIDEAEAAMREGRFTP